MPTPEENRAAWVERQRVKHRKHRVAYFRAFIDDQPCADCRRLQIFGEKGNGVKLGFVYVRGKAERDLSDPASILMGDLHTELRKVDVVCEECQAKRAQRPARRAAKTAR